MNRRHFIKNSAASLLLWPSSRLLASNATARNSRSKKFVFVMMRGALDAIHTLYPITEPDLPTYRPTLSRLNNGAENNKTPLLPLDQHFSLHPALTTLHQWYQDKMMAPIVAVNTGYQSRSHFDGQDLLESGLAQIDHDTGWLGRAALMGDKKGLAVSKTTPIVFRSAKEVNTWYPSNLKAADDDIYDDLANLYQQDSKLSETLMASIATNELVGKQDKKQKNKDKFVELAKACGRLLANQGGPDCAMLEIGGWDTHNNQMNRLNRKLTELDNGLAALQKSLGAKWQDTVVVVATEFGRTVRENGTGGTDHGTASCMFVAGGSLAGGRVLGDWPGLKQENLFENRDLQPTTNAFSWIGAVMSEHWGLTTGQLANIFPDHKPYATRLFRQTKSV